MSARLPQHIIRPMLAIPRRIARPHHSVGRQSFASQARLRYPQPEKSSPPRRVPRSIELLGEPSFDIKLDNVQGDIYPTFPKKAECFVFFTIKDPAAFKKKLAEFLPNITTAAKVIKSLDDIKEFKAKGGKHCKHDLLPMEHIQIAFAKESFKVLGITGGINDPDFDSGPLKNQAFALGDRAVPGSDVSNPELDWEPVWKNTQVHGVLAIATESEQHCKDLTDRKIKSHFGKSINIVNVVQGQVRAAEEGHEHFGFLDGVSEPAIRGLANPHRGQLQCDPGVVFMGRDGDPKKGARPDWTNDGSIMVFRKLRQFVPEFNKFLHDNPLRLSGLTPEEGSALRGARMVGRWKSGAPIDKTPLRDDPTIVSNIDGVNDFDYSILEPGEAVPGQVRCPFSAHIRKTAPRKGGILPPAATERTLIVRAGIPYGPDVTPEEASYQKTSVDRGLLFVCYNSIINPGFKFMQQSWANNTNFPPNNNPTGPPRVAPGQDPIIGNSTDSFVRARAASGINPDNFGENLVMPNDFVVARGGEYFFVPSKSTLKRLASGELLQGTPPSA